MIHIIHIIIDGTYILIADPSGPYNALALCTLYR
jgi:hypothetical protein